MRCTGLYGENTDIDYQSRLLLPDGTITYVRIVGHRVSNREGHVFEVTGTALDATEQHEAEEALRRTQERLARAKQIATVGELAAAIAREGKRASLSGEGSRVPMRS